MKRVIIAAAVMAAVFGISLAGCLTVVHAADIIGADVTALVDLCRAGRSENAVRLAEQTEQHWYRYEKYLSLMLGDDDIAEISADIAKLRPLAEKDSGGLLAEASSIRRRINDLRTKEVPSWYNIL